MIQPYQGNFVKRHVKDFIKAVDEFIKMDGKLVKNFNPEQI